MTRGLSLSEDLTRRLGRIADQGLARTLALPSGIDFSSNDYLGLAADPELRRRTLERLDREEGEPIGAPSSRLLRGHDGRHAALESRLAGWKGTEGALLFPSGYQANLGLLTALLGPGDRAISDAANHASLIDGLRLSGCRKVVVPHLDLGAIEAVLAEPWEEGRTFLITESLYSMDGDIAPLGSYAELCERYGADLIVDDAHAAGVFGRARGSGLAERFGIERRAAAVISTFGKSLGLAGACVAGPRALIDFLVNRARPFIFSTAPPPLLLAAIEAALDLIEQQPERRARPGQLADRLRVRLVAGGLGGIALPPSEGPIVPVILGDNGRAMAVAETLRAQGFDVRAVRPPTVPTGTARLRISVHADRTEVEVDALGDAILAALLGERS